uniref:ShKT domain-containing protein n=1 Tax=Steinernema glaseri TaxID=37863 RepID=A0A1I7Y0P6_9BILA
MFRFLAFVAFFALCSAACEDKDADCVNKAWGCYSSDPTYLAWIRDLCPKTCNCCPDSNTNGGNNGNCQDSTVVTCTQAFCDNQYITDAQKRMYCPVTCKYC